MKVGILGSGIVAKTLGAGFKKHGHEVLLGTRNPDRLKDWTAQGGAISDFAGAAAFGDIVVLAVKGSAAMDVLKLAGSGLEGKPVLDATNPIADQPPEDGVLRFFTDLNQSLMERLQSQFPKSRFVKVFSSVGAGAMVNPGFAGGRPTMFICGNDDAAKQTTTEILDQFGWDVDDMGSAVAARAIEPLCMLWCIPGFKQNDWMHAFKMLR